MNVHVLLYCRAEENIVGNFLFFQTIRTGFPDQDIFVFSNNNDDQFNKVASNLCTKINANFIVLDSEVSHAEHISNLLSIEKNPFYIVDPDTIWYEAMPYSYQALMAGRYIPDFYDFLSESNTYERFHTSCLYLNPSGIYEQLSKVEYLSEFDSIAPSIYYHNGIRYRHDTTSKLYHFFKFKGKTFNFDTEINNKFAHLFCGTHLDVASKAYPQLKDCYQKVLQDPEFGKTLKKEQDLVFLSSSWKTC